MITTPYPHVYRLSENAVVLSFLSEAPNLCLQQKIWALANMCQATGVFSDVVPAMNNLTLYLIDSHQTEHWLQQLSFLWEGIQADNRAGREITIPVYYGGSFGPDLHAVASHHQISEEDVIKRHTEAIYTVYFLGFQPGFAYLQGLDAGLHTPRKSSPRICVPAGSVGIGGAQTGVYPASAPGGWQLIGQTYCTLFSPQTQPPTLLQAGDTVRFIAQPHPDEQAHD